MNNLDDSNEMNGLDELYQELILDHHSRPRNWGALPGATHHAEGHNPLCGDEIKVLLCLDDSSALPSVRITDLRFIGQGCAISRASSSLMTEEVKGKTLAEAKALFAEFHELVKGKKKASSGLLKKAQVLSGVRAFPMRVKCATLAWHTLMAALENKGNAVSTEGEPHV
jgi:nitrogen fixation NifU-like protein